MMSTERRASGLGPSSMMTAGSPRAHNSNSSAVPRDLQRNSDAQSSSNPTPGSPDRKRPRYEPGLGRSADERERSRATATMDEEEMDELDDTEDSVAKRPRGGSDEPKIERKGSGPESISRSSSATAAAAHHAHWAGRSASATLDSRYQQHAPPSHRMRDGMDAGGAQDDRRRYDYDRPYPHRYESGPPGAGMREDGGRHAPGGMVGERYGADYDRDPRDRLQAAENAKMEYNSPSMRMPPPTSSNSGDPNLPGFRNRPSSPPPRLPGFASLEPEVGGLSHRSLRDDGPYSSSPRRGMPFQQQHQHAPSYGSYPPPPPGPNRTPLMHHHPSPTPSTSYGNPPMIHPALAGLPGAGGGPGGKQQPSFVSKLYSMLEDPSISDLISWGSSGTVFSVANPAEFSRLVLPNWFKHSNWQSFVRQLNMYGFHKVNHSYQGNPTDEVQVWEFRHPSFRRGEIALLNDIKRKSSRQKRAGSPRGSIGGADLRADRSGGSSTPSPEVPLATIPGPMMGGGGGGMSIRRDFGYGDERDGYGYDRRDMRGFDQRGGGGYGGPPGDDHYLRGGGGKMEGGPPGIPPSVGPGGGSGMAPPFAPDSTGRRPPNVASAAALDAYMERAEAIARFDDLSERTDAIIRHASFLESQIRILSDQLADSRAFTAQVVREEMVQLLDRLERSFSSSQQQQGVDPTTKMIEVIRDQLAYYTQRHSSSIGVGGGPGSGPGDRIPKQQPHQQQQQQQQQQPSNNTAGGGGGGGGAGGVSKRPSI